MKRETIFRIWFWGIIFLFGVFIFVKACQAKAFGWDEHIKQVYYDICFKDTRKNQEYGNKYVDKRFKEEADKRFEKKQFKEMLDHLK